MGGVGQLLAAGGALGPGAVAISGFVACTSSSPTGSSPDASTDAKEDVYVVAESGPVDSGAPSEAGAGGSVADAVIDVDMAGWCVLPGTPNNEAGFGGYCTSGGDQCPTVFCTADFGAAQGSWYCTAPCSTNGECGSATACLVTPQGSGCAPCACKSDASVFVDGGCPGNDY
jgi:hypothetical protein